MTTALKQNSVYLKLKDGFKKDYFEDKIIIYQGFILGLLAQGATSADRKILTLTFDLFNDSKPFPGEGIAIYTTLLIEMERQLQDKQVQFFIPTPQDREPSQKKKEFNAERLQALAGLAYGVSLAYNFNASCETIKQEDLSEQELEELEMLSNIIQVNPDSKLDEQDIDTVVDYIMETLYRRAKLNRKS